MTQQIYAPVGILLKTAREELGFSTRDIANKLNLTNTVIMYLESDIYTASSRDVFYRGYIRAYAKLLHLPAEELVDNFNLSVMHQQDNKYGMRDDTITQKQLIDNRYAWLPQFFLQHVNSILLILVLICIILIGKWWHNRYQYVPTEVVTTKKYLDDIDQFVEDNSIDKYLVTGTSQ